MGCCQIFYILISQLTKVILPPTKYLPILIQSHSMVTTSRNLNNLTLYINQLWFEGIYILHTMPTQSIAILTPTVKLTGCGEKECITNCCSYIHYVNILWNEFKFLEYVFFIVLTHQTELLFSHKKILRQLHIIEYYYFY